MGLILSTLPASWPSDAGILLGGFSLTYYLWRHSRKGPAAGYSLPPSPGRGWPILGNALEIPLEYPGHVYLRWGKELNSDIVSASALGKTIVVLNSIDVALELLDKRSALYSSRPEGVMLQELLGFDYLFAALPYDERWRERRRTFVQHFRPGDTSIIRPQEEEFVGRLLVELSNSPDKFISSLRGAIGGLIVSLAYGLPVRPHDDPTIAFSEFVIQTISEAGAPGANFVDVLPALKYIPSWFPGAGFKRRAADLSYMYERFRSAPFDAAVAAFGTDAVRPSLVSRGLSALDDGRPDAEHQKQVLKDTAAMFYGAGTDTIFGTTLVWVWLLMKNPKIQQRVHGEVDRVLKGRMPTLDDLEDMPLLMATLLEATRYGPVTPLGVPHCTTDDDIYGKYFIPKGTIVIPNAYGMFRNEENYPDPDTFNPDRFLTKDGTINADVKSPWDYVFGFGRRACPGSHIGKSMVWLTAASLIAVYEWSEPLGEDGVQIDQDEDFEPGFLYHPRPFKCEWKVRSLEAEIYLGDLRNST